MKRTWQSHAKNIGAIILLAGFVTALVGLIIIFVEAAKNPDSRQNWNTGNGKRN